jgi:hypothetical protein
MEHKQVKYQILQTMSRRQWKWVVHFPTETKVGVCASKMQAIQRAINEIDRAKNAEERARFNAGPVNPPD